MSKIYDMTPGDLKKQVLGCVVTSVDEEANTITLDNGNILEFRGEESCCAWFSAELKAGNLTDNAVTAIGVTDRGSDEDWSDEDYTIHIIAANKNIVDVNITGNPTSGYYCHSITLVIKGNAE